MKDIFLMGIDFSTPLTSSAREGKLEFFPITSRVVGLEKMKQEWLKAFLTQRGSGLNPETGDRDFVQGTEVESLLRLQINRKANPSQIVKGAVKRVIDQATATVKANQAQAKIPDDERLVAVSLDRVGFSLTTNTISIKVTLASAAGEGTSLKIPVPIPGA